MIKFSSFRILLLESKILQEYLDYFLSRKIWLSWLSSEKSCFTAEDKFTNSYITSRAILNCAKSNIQKYRIQFKRNGNATMDIIVCNSIFVEICCWIWIVQIWISNGLIMTRQCLEEVVDFFFDLCFRIGMRINFLKQ